jgi:hypothetical protein
VVGHFDPSVRCPPPLHITIAMSIPSLIADDRHHHPSRSAILITAYSTVPLILDTIMVLSSFNALNKIEAGGMMELNDYITRRLDSSIKAELEKPVGLHFVVEEKIFKGTNQPFVSCPIQFRLRDRSQETKVCQPVWTDSSHRSKVNKKAKVGVKKLSVLRIDDYSIVPHKRAPLGYLFFVRNYLVVKRDVDQDAYDRWLMD